jgi:Lon protease-like protein
MRKALDQCRAQAVYGLSLDESVSCVDDIHRVIQQATAVQLALVRHVDALQVAAAMGATSTLAWLRDRHRVSHSAASRLVKLAQAVDADAGSPVAEAFAAGAVNVEQVQVIADAVAKLPAAHRRTGEEHLVGEAEIFGPKELGRLGQRIFEVVAPDEAEKQALDELERAERRAWQDRGLWLTDIAGTSRVRVTGWLDQEGAASVRAALDPLCAPRTTRRTARRAAAELGADNDTDASDTRSAGQRRVDALIEICRLASACGELPDNGGDRPQVVVTIDYDRLRDQVGAAMFDDGSQLSAAEARRIACDAGIIPAVLGAAGQVLDVGRQSRLTTGPLRRALVLRDRGCAFPGCDRPPRWTDAHHIVHWSNGGSTELPNLVLLCSYHHRLVHHSEWRVRINPKDGLPDFIPPAYVDADQKPRRNRYHRRE